MAGILQYADHIHDIHNLAKYLPTPSLKGGDYNQADWAVREKEWSEYEIRVETKDWVPTSIQDEMEDKDKEYRSLPHE